MKTTANNLLCDIVREAILPLTAINETGPLINLGSPRLHVKKYLMSDALS